MSVGILVITHHGIGAELVKSATAMLGLRPLPIETLDVNGDQEPEAVLADAKHKVESLEHSDGVLVLTDMFGSTPSNVAVQLAMAGQVAVVAGVNLPMLVRVLNYPRLSLAELTAKALSGGREGILVSANNLPGR